MSEVTCYWSAFGRPICLGVDAPNGSTSEDQTPKSQMDVTMTKNWEDIPAFRRRLVKKRASPDPDFARYNTNNYFK